MTCCSGIEFMILLLKDEGEGVGVKGGHAVGLWAGDERARDNGFDGGGGRVGAVRALNNNFGAFEMHHWQWHNHLPTILKLISDDDQQQHQISCVSVIKPMWTLTFHCRVETCPTESSLTSLPYAPSVEDVPIQLGCTRITFEETLHRIRGLSACTAFQYNILFWFVLCSQKTGLISPPKEARTPLHFRNWLIRGLRTGLLGEKLDSWASALNHCDSTGRENRHSHNTQECPCNPCHSW